jgi:hypothetical protein
MRVEGLGNLEKFSDIGIRTCYLPACSIVPQAALLPRASIVKNNLSKLCDCKE